MMLIRSVLAFVILSAWTIRQSESSSTIRMLIIRGRASPRHKWPWLVALVNKIDNKLFCGGSLVSERFILTAAHCIQNKGEEEPRKPKDVNVHLGKWNLTDKTEQNAVRVIPEKFIVHADWDIYDTRWDADIAMVKLSYDVTLSNSIQPVRLWTSQMQPDEDEFRGIMIGWGRTENQTYGEHSDVPWETEVEILPTSNCTQNYYLKQAISYRGLCVGGKEGVPCHGDSGGGLFSFGFRRWFLRGIVSMSLIDSSMRCRVDKPFVFTNVEKFTSWIDQILDGVEQSPLL